MAFFEDFLECLREKYPFLSLLLVKGRRGCSSCPKDWMGETFSPEEGIENLPFELQRNFQLMRDLDQRTEDLKSEIDKLATEYISNARTLSSEEKLGLLKQIQEAYGKCKEFGDDKVQLAMQTYEMVDKHIRRLDTDLARFEADLKEKQIESSDYDSSSSKGKKKGRAQKEKKAARARSKGKNSDEEAPKAAQKKLKLVRTSTEYGMPSVTFGNVHPSDVLDMPVDPNEPTYCLCHQVSYGEMIGCDNPDVRACPWCKWRRRKWRESCTESLVLLGQGLIQLAVTRRELTSGGVEGWRVAYQDLSASLSSP
ncbi:inhibitor of growth protein 4 isoform 1-T1 [Amazona ochrocephala]